ncbi:MAG: DUF2292 domain-containing protein [Nitrospirae bacterium]|nr:MAG: DUF2292 domain-containing protein [Nitrospirota bacterium]
MDALNVGSQAKAQTTIQTILRALSGIRYGSLEIIVHDSEIVQIERKEKIRIGPQAGQKA